MIPAQLWNKTEPRCTPIFIIESDQMGPTYMLPILLYVRGIKHYYMQFLSGQDIHMAA